MVGAPGALRRPQDDVGGGTRARDAFDREARGLGLGLRRREDRRRLGVRLQQVHDVGGSLPALLAELAGGDGR